MQKWQQANGEDPGVTNVYVGSAAEGKNVSVSLHPVSRAKNDFKEDVEQNVTLVQPMVEVMAISEVCVSRADIPVVNIFGNGKYYYCSV